MLPGLLLENQIRVFYWQPRYGETRIANENLVLGTEQIQQINLAPDIKEQLFKIY